MEQTTYIGLDLAWSGRNRSGAAALRGSLAGAMLLEPPALLGDLDSIVDYILGHAGAGPAIVAVDAPLLVANQAGRRRAEAELSAAFRRHEAGAHPANRGLLARDGVVRGEALVEALGRHGFGLAPMIAAGAPGRLVVEVFPHPAAVALFGLAKTLKYKLKPGRSPDLRAAEWARYLGHLAGLAGADPPLLGDLSFLAGWAGAPLKGLEDRADALLCAYIGLYGQRWGAERCRCFGDPAEGTIFTPVPVGW